jgi:competence protein ComFC
VIVRYVLGLLFPPRCVACHCAGAALCEACIASFGPASSFACGWFPCRALGSYSGELRTAILRMKGGRRDVAEHLGIALAHLLAGRFDRRAVLVPIPTTARRRRARGFDQSRLLVSAAARRLHARVLDALEQTAGDAQHGRSRAQRLAASGRFQLRSASLLQGARVVLVDDVATTGATLRDAAETLERAGAHVLGAAVVARAFEIDRSTMNQTVFAQEKP